MNKIRRKQLEAIISKIEVIKEELSVVLDDEETYRDNIPENLMNSDKYEMSEVACDSLTEAISTLEETVSQIEEAI